MVISTEQIDQKQRSEPEGGDRVISQAAAAALVPTYLVRPG